MEVGENDASLHILGNKSELAMGHLVVLQISQRRLEDTSLQALAGNLGALGSINKRLTQIANAKHGGRFHIVPFLAGKRIDNLLLGALLALLEALVLTDGHGGAVSKSKIEKETRKKVLFWS